MQEYNEIFTEVYKEIIRANSIHPDKFNSYHEGYAVLLEELDELWNEIKKKEPKKVFLKEECLHIIVTGIKFLTSFNLIDHKLTCMDCKEENCEHSNDMIINHISVNECKNFTLKK